ncbi:tail fiber domain-containing protein [Sulfurovum sp. CS9]|uniref:tail fiber domain-containing protein n=1 Tax=Sulfurovum sp. CS9 TaxID=3391146 RepID=UPI0039EC2782
MKKVKQISIIAASILLSPLLLVQLNAADVIVSSGMPVIDFDDTNTVGDDWRISGNRNYWYLRNQVNDVVAMRFPKQSIAANSFIAEVSTGNIDIADGAMNINRAQKNALISDSSGDINLANGSVFIDRSADRMGIGTTTPSGALHVKSSGNTDFYLENGTGSAIWRTRIGGSSLDYYITDITNGTQPFTIENNTASNTLYLDSTNNVGIGTNSPQAKLDIRGDIASAWAGSNTVGDGLTNLLVLSASNSEVDKSSDVGFRLVNGSTSKGWNFRTNSGGDSFQATLQGTGGAEFTVTNATSDVSGTELYLGNGAKNVGGVWINASSRALKENIKELSTQDALAAFHKLQPVTYNYKSDKKEQVVGFIAEDVPELVAIQSRDGLSSMDMVAVLTKVLQEQEKNNELLQQRVGEQEQQLTATKTQLETMQQRVVQLESILTNLALDTSNASKEKVSLK